MEDRFQFNEELKKPKIPRLGFCMERFSIKEDDEKKID